MNRSLFSLSLGFFLLLNFSCVDRTEQIARETPSIIPKPEYFKSFQGSFIISEETTIYAPEEFKNEADFLVKFLEQGANIALTNVSGSEADILFNIDTSLEEEQYNLDVSKEQIVIQASTAAGAFYAVQSLRQLLPEELENESSYSGNEIRIPWVRIVDRPKFAYRGMHLDVARHFFPKEFIKEYIDHLAMLKMNYFHWHLTEDQGWRIEIEQFPRLTFRYFFPVPLWQNLHVRQYWLV